MGLPVTSWELTEFTKQWISMDQDGELMGFQDFLLKLSSRTAWVYGSWWFYHGI
jgi:hypothetical protein